MSYNDLPDDIKVRFKWFDDQQDHWQALSDKMWDTWAEITRGDRIPPFSNRIPANLRSFGDAANKALDAYMEALLKGYQCAGSVSTTISDAGKQYLRNEGYAEDQVDAIDRELN